LEVGASTSLPTPWIFGAHPIIKVLPTLPIDVLARVTSPHAPKSDGILPKHPRLARTEKQSDNLFSTAAEII
jgi:hypothetical protein